MNKKLLWITRTAIFLALIVVVQFTTKGLPIFATGSLVNLILITCGLTAGLPSGLTVAGLSPVFALLLGVQSPLTAPLLPIIMVGNMVIVLTVWFFTKESQKYKPLQKSFTQIFGLIIGAGLKFYILYTLVSIVLPLLHLSADTSTGISFSFSWPQLVTALLGGAVALSIYPLLKKGIKN